MAEVMAHGQVLDGSTTVRKWAAQWLEVYVAPRDATPKSLEMYRQKLDRYILPAVGSMKLRDVRDTHLQKMLNAANSSRSTAEKVRLVTQALFRQARKSRLIPWDPAEDLQIPKAPEGKRRSITDFERRHILALAETHRSGLYVLLLLYCGLRPNEAAALQWSDVDLDAGTLHISKALESGDYRTVKDPKTDAAFRDVPIPAPLLERLRAAKPADAPFSPVLLQPKGGRRHTEDSLRCAWTGFKRDLDISMGAELYRNKIVRHAWELHPLSESREQWEELTAYCLRHTYGTDLQTAGVPINVAKYLMGHSDISVTANVYTHTTDASVAAARGMLENYYVTTNVTTPETPKPGDLENTGTPARTASGL